MERYMHKSCAGVLLKIGYYHFEYIRFGNIYLVLTILWSFSISYLFNVLFLITFLPNTYMGVQKLAKCIM